jgi:recombination protein RecA
MANEREAKLKALQSTIDRLDKLYGKGTVMRLGDKQTVDIDVIPTGSLSLDIAVGINGLPKGRIIEIYGPESSGKTTIAIHAIAECQKMGGIAAFVDAEHAFDRFYAANLGVDVDSLLIAQPDHGEQALEITENLIRSGAVDIVVVDSVAALVPRAEIEGEMGDSKMGLQARLMSQAMRKLTGAIGRTNCCCIFINQLREKIGVMFGNPETTTGGNALKFYASMRLDIRKTGSAIKDKEGNIVGNHVKVKVAKNKLAAPFRIANFDIVYGKGVSKVGEIVDIGVDNDIIGKSGSWYSYDGSKIAQGREAAKIFLEDNPEVAFEIEQKIKAAILGTAAGDADTETKKEKKKKKEDEAEKA